MQKSFYWEEAIHDKVKQAWETKAGQCYGQYMSNMRNSNRNPSQTKPDHVPGQVWKSWVAKWNSAEFKEISNQNKINRRNGVADGPAPPPTHTARRLNFMAVHSKMVTCLIYLKVSSDYVGMFLHLIISWYLCRSMN